MIVIWFLFGKNVKTGGLLDSGSCGIIDEGFLGVSEHARVLLRRYNELAFCMCFGGGRI